MIRVLTVVLSVWAASAAADHGTEEAAGGQQSIGAVWADDFRAQVTRCFTMGQQQSGPVAYAAVTFEMTPDARPVAHSIRLSSPLGTAGEAEGLEAARRAILRCGQPNYNLPLDLFSQWQFVEISFPYFVQLN